MDKKNTNALTINGVTLYTSYNDGVKGGWIDADNRFTEEDVNHIITETRANNSIVVSKQYKDFTFCDVAEMWFKNKRPFIKYTSACTYALILSKYVIPEFGHKKGINEKELQIFIFKAHKEGLSRHFLRDIVALIRQVIKFGKKRNLLFGEDCTDIILPVERKRVLDSQITLSVENQKKLLKHLTENLTPKNLGIFIVCYTGLRIGEVCGLRWDDINFKDKIMTIERTVSQVYNCLTKKSTKISTTPKTKNSNREIPICSPLLKVLKQAKKEAVSDYVISSLKNPLSPREYRDYYARLLSKLKIPYIKFHGLRHTFATRCIESKCDVKTLSAILGHSNVSTTLNIYVHPNSKQKISCINKMAKVFKLD